MSKKLLKCPVAGCSVKVSEADMIHHLCVDHGWSLRKAVKYGPLCGGEGRGLHNV